MTAETVLQETYSAVPVSWDFTTIWAMNPNVGYKLPYLRWQDPADLPAQPVHLTGTSRENPRIITTGAALEQFSNALVPMYFEVTADITLLNTFTVSGGNAFITSSTGVVITANGTAAFRNTGRSLMLFT